jgi:Lon protease-like protein
VLPASIPLFPLPNVVLFPAMPLPLHIFEPRYRLMVEESLAGDRVIGMTLLQPGWESSYEGRPPVYPWGCAGTLEQWEAVGDGRYNILLKGSVRFRILEERDGKPYRRARVEGVPEPLGEPQALDQARKKVMDAIGMATDQGAILVVQPELHHEIFVNALSQSLELTPLERQSLLEAPSVLERYERLASILDFRSLQRRAHGSRETPVA